MSRLDCEKGGNEPRYILDWGKASHEYERRLRFEPQRRATGSSIDSIILIELATDWNDLNAIARHPQLVAQIIFDSLGNHRDRARQSPVDTSAHPPRQTLTDI